MSKLRRAVGDDYPLALSSFPYVDYHPSFPYSVFLGPGGAQYNLPQLYWYAIGDPLAVSVRHTYAFNRPYGRPQLPVGQTWQDPPKGQVLDFRRLARAYGSTGRQLVVVAGDEAQALAGACGQAQRPAARPAAAGSSTRTSSRAPAAIWSSGLSSS